MEQPPAVGVADRLDEVADQRETVKEGATRPRWVRELVQADLAGVALEDERGAELVLVEALRPENPRSATVLSSSYSRCAAPKRLCALLRVGEVGGAMDPDAVLQARTPRVMPT